MKRIHMPEVDPRYWTAITLASIFGTNLGDLYAHESGLGIGLGLAVLVCIALVALQIERQDRWAHEAYYWLVIVIIRTGATNIADYLAFRIRIPAPVLTLGLAALLGALAWRSVKETAARTGLPETNASYWCAMLAAGVFGTVVGDIVSHAVGQGLASLGLGAMLGLLLVLRGSGLAATIAGYWLAIAAARCAGTAIGDWIAESKALHIGLPLSTLATGLAFVTVLALWPRHRTTAADRLSRA